MGEVFIRLYERTMPGLVDGGFDWVDVRDVVDSAVRALEHGKRGERYLLSGHYASMKELAALAGEITGRRPPRFVAPIWLARLALPFTRWQSDITSSRPLFTAESLSAVELGNPRVRYVKASVALDHRPRPLRETVADAYAWFREKGYLST